MPKAAVTLKDYKSESRPELKWIVVWPSPEPGRPRKRRRFKTKTAAKDFVITKEAEILNAGTGGAALKGAAQLLQEEYQGPK